MQHFLKLITKNNECLRTEIAHILGCIWSKYDLLNFSSSNFCIVITKTCLYNVDPLKPHFYIVKLGFTGVYIILLISAQKHRLWVPTIYVLSRNMKNIRIFYLKIFSFLEVKFSTYLNRRVFVMYIFEQNFFTGEKYVWNNYYICWQDGNMYTHGTYR